MNEFKSQTDTTGACSIKRSKKIWVLNPKLDLDQPNIEYALWNQINWKLVRLTEISSFNLVNLLYGTGQARESGKIY